MIVIKIRNQGAKATNNFVIGKFIYLDILEAGTWSTYEIWNVLCYCVSEISTYRIPRVCIFTFESNTGERARYIEIR